MRTLLHEVSAAQGIGETAAGFGGQQVMLLLPELFLLLGVVLIPFIGRVFRDVKARQNAALLLVGLSLVSVVGMLLPGTQVLFGFGPQASPEAVLGVYDVTPFALFFKLVFLVVALLVVLVSPTSMKPAARNTEFYTLLLVATFGMLMVASARDLLTLFVGLETAALASYPLAGYRKGDVASTEAATKFIVIGALASALTLYGMSLLYGATGTLDLHEIAAVAGNGQNAKPGLMLAIVFLVAGFGFKVTSVPFHMWAPDVYQGAPTPVSALLAAGSKKMGLAAFVKVFLLALMAVKFQWDVLVGVLAVATMTVGNLMALRQRNIKRLLAWSSVAQAGYMLIAFPVGTQLVLAGALFHVLTHAVMKGGAFALVAVLAARGLGEDLKAWAGLHRRAPVLAFAMALLMLSMAGIPPLAGFASKFLLFYGAVDAGLAQGNRWFILLAVAGVLNSVVSLAYYARVIRAMYFDEEERPAVAPAPALFVYRTPVWVAVYIILVGVLIMGVWPEPFVNLAMDAAAAIIP